VIPAKKSTGQQQSLNKRLMEAVLRCAHQGKNHNRVGDETDDGEERGKELRD
jgi:hypothetical protein